MPRYALTIAYDGTEFHGWQKQELVVPEGAGAKDVLPGGGRNVAYERVGDVLLVRTVQHVVERAVGEVVREPVRIMGASRTDSGVHARGQVAAFSTSAGEERGRGWPSERGTLPMLRAINSRLPEDVLVRDVRIVDDAFDPVTHCTAKGYSYTLHVSPHRPLWDRRYVQHIWRGLDVGAMAEAAARFVGEHDFAAFAAAGHGRQTTVRKVFTCDVVGGAGRATARPIGSGGAGVSPAPLACPTREVSSQRRSGTRSCGCPEGAGETPAPPRQERAGAGGTPAPPMQEREGAGGTPAPPGREEECERVDWESRLRVEISGNGFLWNMVRIIVGTLVEVGRGKLTPEDVSRALREGDRRLAGPTFPPTGLCLEWVKYE